MKRACLALLIAAVAIAADKPADATKKEFDRLQGTWTPSSMVFNGKEFSVEGKNAFRMTFKGDTASVEGSDEIKKDYGKVKFKLDPSTKPKIVDLTVTAGGQENAKMEGIYELKDDEFKLCVKVFGADRPTEFAAPEGTSVVLVVLKREKK